MSDVWYGVRRGRCSISIALTKLDFNVHAVSACIRKQCHGRRKELDYLSQNLKDFMDFYKRQLRCKREEMSDSFLSRKNRSEEQLVLIQLRSTVRKETGS